MTDLYFSTILGWIRSCDRIDQLSVCVELINNLFVKRFDGILSKDDLLIKSNRLFQALEEKEEYMKKMHI